MTDLMSIRLALKTRRAVHRIARATGRSQSDVVREAIEDYVAKRPAHDTAYEAWKDVIGIAQGLPPDLSEHTGEKVRQSLQARRRRRR
jgi:predicted transcriptional regulator